MYDCKGTHSKSKQYNNYVKLFYCVMYLAEITTSIDL